MDATLAQTLKRSLETFAKPWWKLRQLRVFRDDSNLSASPDLWSSIVDALNRTRFMLLLASPESAASPWVRRELEWWLDHRGPDSVLVAVTAGRAPWSEGEIAEPMSLPGDIADRFPRKPRWIDLRQLHSEPQVSRHNPALLDAVADIGAAVRRIEKDQLVGEHIRQHRRTVRTAWSAVTLLVLLVVATVVAAASFAVQRNTARQQASIATSRLFAASAQTQVGSNLNLAMLLAAKSFAMHQEPRTYGAVLQAATTSPKLVGFAYTSSDVTTLSAVREHGRSAVLVGEQDGTVAELDTGARTWTRVGRLQHPVLSTAASGDGSWIAATDGHDVVVYGPGADAKTILSHAATSVTALAVTPDATHVIVAEADYAHGRGSLTLVDLARGTHTTRALAGFAPSQLAATDTSIAAFDGLAGVWASVRLRDLHTVRSMKPQFGAHDYASAMSVDGSAFTFTNSAATIPVWDTATAKDGRNASIWEAAPTGWGRGPGVDPTALALSPGGQRLAVSDAGTIYVSQPTALEARAGVTWTLTGMAGVGIRSLTFLDQNRLVSSGHRLVALWDLNRVSTIATWQPAAGSAGCTACSGSVVVPSPDGQEVAYLDPDLPYAVYVHDYRTGRERHVTASPATATYGSPVWSADSRSLLLAHSDGRVEVRASNSMRMVALWPTNHASEMVTAARLVGGGSRYATLSVSGRLTLRDARSGRVLSVSARVLGHATEGSPGLRMGAIDANATRVAVVQKSGLSETSWVRVIDISTGRITSIRGQGFVLGVEYAGPRLLLSEVSYASRTGSITVIGGSNGTTVRQRLDTGSGMLEAAVGDDSGALIVYQRLDGALVLVDTRSATTLVTIAMPASIEGLQTGFALDRTAGHLYTVTNSDSLNSG